MLVVLGRPLSVPHGHASAREIAEDIGVGAGVTVLRGRKGSRMSAGAMIWGWNKALSEVGGVLESWASG